MVPSPPTHSRLTRHSTEVTQDGACVIGEDGEVPSMSAGESTGVTDGRGETLSGPQDPGRSSQRYLENGSDFPTGKPLPWVLVSTLPQCTATWQSFSSTSLQYSCCRESGHHIVLPGAAEPRLGLRPRGRGLPGGQAPGQAAGAAGSNRTPRVTGPGP